MKYKCLSVREFEFWLTVDKIYDGELAIIKGLSGYIEIKKADDGYLAYAPSNQFAPFGEYRTSETSV